MTRDLDLVYHLSTPPGEGALAVVEVFGEGAERFLRLHLEGPLPPPGRLRLATLRDGHGGAVDEVIVSFVEPEAMWCRLGAWVLSLHGGLWLKDRVTRLLEEAGGRALGRRDVLALAVRRGALDALQAAAWELLLEAATERAAAFFLRQCEGELSRRLRRFLDLLEGGGARLGAVGRGLGRLLDRYPAAHRLVAPLRILIAGPPASGKSTLLNRLVERERVVTAPEPGTTRDLIEEPIAVAGYPLRVADSAGLSSDPRDPVESEAVRRVWEERPDAVLYLLAPPWRLAPSDRRFLERFPSERVLVVGNFLDRSPSGPRGDAALVLSALEGIGLEGLKGEISRRWLDPAAGGAVPAPGRRDPPALFTPRQAELAAEALRACDAGALDAVRRLLIICLESSWP